jgi:hypothetical protein
MARKVSLCVEEGQQVFFYSKARYIASEMVRVTSVSPLWANLSNGFKANRYSGVCDGGEFPSPGTIYCSTEDWEEEQALYKTWAKLRREIERLHDLPEGITRRKLLMVRRLLQIGE